MKIKSMTCAECGSDNVLIEIDCSGGLVDKDLVVVDDTSVDLGYEKGQVLSIEKLKWILNKCVEDEDILIAVCCCGQCEDEQDVNIELDNGTIFSAGGTYYGPRGNEINTVDACLFELIKQPTNEYVIFYIDQDEPIHYICECHDLEYKKGNGFYEVTKTESVKSKKEIIAQRKDTGALIFGDEAKNVFGIELGKDFKFTPKKNDEYKMFVQSTSPNRILKDETFMIYKNENGGNDNTLFFFSYVSEEIEDKSNGDVVVVLGTQKEIDKDELMGRFNFSKRDDLADALDDDGSLCEHYLFLTNKTVEEAKSICLGFGLVENPKLEKCGWA